MVLADCRSGTQAADVVMRPARQDPPQGQGSAGGASPRLIDGRSGLHGIRHRGVAREFRTLPAPRLYPAVGKGVKGTVPESRRWYASHRHGSESAAGHSALVVPVNGEGGCHDARRCEQDVAIGGPDASPVTYLQRKRGLAHWGEAAGHFGTIL